MERKGQTGGVFPWLISAGLGLVTVALLFSFGGDILATVQDDQCGSGDNLSTTECEDETTAYNVSGNGLGALTNVGNYLPTIGLVVAVGAILVILFAVIARIQR